MSVIAIDVGFGTTAVVDRINGQNADCTIFQSRAVPCDFTGQKSLTGGVLKERDTVTVEVNGINYEVGPDAAKIGLTHNDTKTLSDAYITSSKYYALFLGALSRSSHDEISMLVGGLPVSAMHRTDELVNLMKGEHKVGSRLINVRDARVIPQPLGALMHHAKTEAKAQKVGLMSILAQKTRVVVDPGFGTFDFLTVIGVQPDEKRSGAAQMGQGRLLSEISDYLKSIFKIDIALDMIDDALVNGSFKIRGVEYQFPKNVSSDKAPEAFNCQPIIDQHCRDAIDVMRNKLGDAIDVEEFLICGGPAPLYSKYLKQAYPRHQVLVIDDNDIAVALGMGEVARQVAGSSALKAVS
ncbi:ParM/StbA family protein [Vibrio owensii]|uniref:ParM/StbA family protein n=1 Tax=Vibrio owensii TaxID=696485 RepID=UPI004068DAD5